MSRANSFMTKHISRLTVEGITLLCNPQGCFFLAYLSYLL